jgi:phosphopantetheinyl transferase (holo-ACP synthase)
VRLHGGASVLASERGITEWHLTLTHTHRVAEAIAVAL